MAKVIINKEFQNRGELDAFVRSRLGEDQKENINYEIELAEEEGIRLSLDQSTKVYGVKVRVIKK